MDLEFLGAVFRPGPYCFGLALMLFKDFVVGHYQWLIKNVRSLARPAVSILYESLQLLFKLTTLKCVEGKVEKNLNSVSEGLKWWSTFI